MANVKIEGLDKLVRKFGALAARDLLEPPMQRAVLRVHARMATYPGPKPGSSYVRTGKLGQSWTTKVTKTGTQIAGVVGTVRVYAPVVQSRKFQATMHKPLWKNTDQAVMDEERDRIVADFRRTVQRELAK